MSLREQVAHEAFVYGVPAVALYRILHELVLAGARRLRVSSFNQVSSGPLPAGLRELVGDGAPDSTPFCGWFDLRGGPVVLTVPSEGVERSASVSVLDLYADQVGQVPLGIEPAGRSLLLVGPSWEPALWTGVAEIHRCRTDLCLAVGQTVPGAARGPVRVLQSPVSVQPLGEETALLPLPTPVPPVDVSRPPTAAFLVVLGWMLPLMPAPPGEDELRAGLETIGLGCGDEALAEALEEDRLDGQLTQGLRRGFEDVRQSSHEAEHACGAVPADYMARAARVLTGLLEEDRVAGPGRIGDRPGRRMAPVRRSERSVRPDRSRSRR